MAQSRLLLLGQYRPYTKPIVTFTMASISESRRASIRPVDSTLLGKKYWRSEFGPELATKCIPELLFQQRHDIGNRSLANFWRCCSSVGPYLIYSSVYIAYSTNTYIEVESKIKLLFWPMLGARESS